MTKKDILKAKCQYCGKEIFSLYKGQLEYNHKAHELSCKLKTKLEQQKDNNKRDVETFEAHNSHNTNTKEVK